MGYRHGDCRPCAVRRRPGNPRSEAKHTSAGRISSILGPSAGLVLTSLAIVAPVGLMVAAAGSLIDRVRTIAFGAIPILVAAAWPGPEQTTALVLGLIAVSVLSAACSTSFSASTGPLPASVSGW